MELSNDAINRVMKKTILVLLLLAPFVANVHAQTGKEWTQQKKTQIEYLLKQVAALQSYAQVAAKGYTIAQNGLTVIKNIKHGDFTLHADYFASLGHVNPRVKAYWKIAAIVALEIELLEQCRNERPRLLRSNRNTVDLTAYCNTVIRILLGNSAALANNLIAVTTDNTLQMKDDDRIKQIDKLYTIMKDYYTFFRDFCTQVNVVKGEQTHEAIGIKALRSLYTN